MDKNIFRSTVRGLKQAINMKKDMNCNEEFLEWYADNNEEIHRLHNQDMTLCIWYAWKCGYLAGKDKQNG